MKLSSFSVCGIQEMNICEMNGTNGGKCTIIKNVQTAEITYVPGLIIAFTQPSPYTVLEVTDGKCAIKR